MKNINEIYDYVDYVWAAYPNNNLNVKYAISNKYFESLNFQKKIIVSSKTELSNLVISKNQGFSINPFKKKEIEKLFSDELFIKYKVKNIYKKSSWSEDSIFLGELYDD